MIGVVIPVHNEEKLLRGCLRSVAIAAEYARRYGEEVRIVIVLDSCGDRSAHIAADHDVHTLTVAARNVGIARNLGAQWLINAGARWLAFTDADTRVSHDWLWAQLALNADAVCGSIAVEDWHHHRVAVRQQFQTIYRDCDGHRHIHGANLGVATHAYLTAGGFLPLEVGEDVALVEALAAIGAYFLERKTARAYECATSGTLQGWFCGLFNSSGAAMHLIIFLKIIEKEYSIFTIQ